MGHSRAQIWFYVPSPELVTAVPPSIREYWPWVDKAVKAAPAPLANGKGLCTWLGPYNWTIQTFLYLREAGVPCQLTAELPDVGVVIGHGDFLPPEQKPSRRQFFVEIKPDRPLQCRHANFVVVQNRHDPLRSGLSRWLVASAFVNYWPQPGLLPRDPARGDRFDNVCFMGNPEQFLAETDEVAAEVQKLGLTFHMVPRNAWHDYRTADAVVAIRPLAALASKSKETVSFFMPTRKPASKLYNAWLAGVPVVLSPEVAFQDLRRSTLDYIEASTIPELVEALARLKADPALRQAMSRNGQVRAAEFSAAQTVDMWRSLLDRRILPAYRRWMRSPLRRRWLFSSRQFAKRVSAIA